MITAVDVAWATGFLEGEGTFASSGRGGVFVKAPQIQLEPLERLQRIFGGRINPVKTPTSAGNILHYWVVYGTPAAAVTMTVLSLLSPRRTEQALKLLNRWKNAPGHAGKAKTHCSRGHEFTEDNIYRSLPNKEHRRCKTCTKYYAALRTKAVRARAKEVRAAITNT